jgi:uncharacterized protein
MSATKEFVAEHLELIVFFGAISFFVHWAAWKNGFFFLNPEKAYEQKIKAAPNLNQLLTLFAIYLGIALILIPSIAHLFFSGIKEESKAILAIGYLQLISIGLTLLGFLIFCLTQNQVEMKKIWKDRTRLGARSIGYDILMGLLTWVISFPMVIFIGQIADLFIYLFFRIETYEQVAVRYLKLALSNPTMLAIAIFSVLVAAPVIEEFLFRGFLQNWFKRFLGAKAAIAVTALCFALFHLASSQGIGNISLGISLLTLGCYLGFIYERQGSLFASISLHMAFNAVSTLRIIAGGA